MKSNASYDGGAMRDDPQIYAAYALYLAKFVKSYAAVGVEIAMLVPQNEPGEITHYPSCDWRPQQYVSFISDYLAPTFRSQSISTKLYVGTINRSDWNVLSVLEADRVRSQIFGVALQWNGLEHVAKIHARFPTLDIMQSETECGNNHWQPGFNRDVPPNDFRYAAYTWRKFRDFMRAGSSSYMLWNLVLDEQGKNIDSRLPWPQNSAVVIDRRTKHVTYTPMYFATKHFSGLIDTGARLVASSGSFVDGVAFVNPDGTAVVELLNAKAGPQKLVIRLGERAYELQLPALSIASLLVNKQQG
jgi:glucosylceramidase